jgi:acyl transferase domain-containing protein
VGTPNTPTIAIIGMASILPEAHNLREYWENILAKRDCIRDVPASHWHPEDYYDPDPSVADKTYSKRGGFIPFTNFDPFEFGMPPNLLETTDASQLLALVVAKQVLEDAGYGSDHSFDRERTGVILGVTGGQKLIAPLISRLQYPIWNKVLRQSGLSDVEISLIIERIKQSYIAWDENAFPGLLGNVIAGRIANRFDLGGINCAVDAACASSLAALKMAISELAEHRSDMIITGGIDTDNSIFTYLCFSKTPAFSHQDSPRPFDQSADGTIIGEGIGMLLLKRLDDAERDHDHVYAVIRGIGTSSDGRHKSIYAPHAKGQVRALQRAYEDAGFAPWTVGLVEAHGTGTVAGDLAEFDALCQVFAKDNHRTQHIALGSVKSQIGHTKATAGVAGVIKATLALHHHILPPTLHVTHPNPKLMLETSPFYLNTETRPWFRAVADPPRRAAISSFGFGGTNYHVILEEYNNGGSQSKQVHDTLQSIILSAHTPSALAADCATISDALVSDSGENHFAELVANRTSSVLDPTTSRIGITAQSPAEASTLLRTCVEHSQAWGDREAWQHPQGIFYRRSGMRLDGGVVALFSGQGSQYLEMGKELTLNFLPMRAAYAAMDEVLLAHADQMISTVVFPPPVFDPARRVAQLASLQQTRYAQPAIAACSVGMYRILFDAGFRPDMVAGHSFGELTALWAAGVLSEVDYFALAYARGQSMTIADPDADRSGAMLAISGNVQAAYERAQEISPDIWVANWNAPSQIVLSGSSAAIDLAEHSLQKQGYSVQRLAVSAAFHSPLVAHAQPAFRQTIDRVPFRPANLPIYANATGLPYPIDPDAMRALLVQQITSPVRFQEQIEHMYAAGGRCFVEFGPRGILTNLVHSILGDRPHMAIALNAQYQKDSDRQLREAVTQLRVAGLAIESLNGFPENRFRSRVSDRKQFTLPINGSNYVSDKTRQAFDNALRDGDEIVMPPRSAHANPDVPATLLPATPAQSADFRHSINGSEGVVNRLDVYQHETLQIHEKHLVQQAEATSSLFQLVQQQMQWVMQFGVRVDPTVLQSLERMVSLVSDHQATTLALNGRYLDQRHAYAEGVLQFLQEESVRNAPMFPQQAQEQYVFPELDIPASSQPFMFPSGTDASEKTHGLPQIEQPMAPIPAFTSPAYPSPTPTAQSTHRPQLSRQSIERVLLSVISEKTGYRAEILNSAMAMEADLGIDSIKRIEILAAIQSQFPDLLRVKVEDLAEIDRLDRLVDQLCLIWGVETAPARAGPPAFAIDPLPMDLAALDHKPRRTVARLRQLPPPDRIDAGLPQSYICVVTHDGTALTSAVVEALQKRNWPIVLLCFPERLANVRILTPNELPLVVLRELSEQHIAETLHSITERFGSIGAFIHIHPPYLQQHVEYELFSYADQVIVKSLFLMARHLKTSLIEAAHLARGWFVTITRLDGNLGLGSSSDFAPVVGGLFGLTKTINLEWETVLCRSIDINPQFANEQAVAAIVAELFDPNRFVVEVGYGSNGRVTIVSDEI